MLVAPPKRPRDTEENILPLINIVFLLLIFFMLAGALHSRAPFELDPPETAHAGEAQPQPNLLSIAGDGRLALGGEPVTRPELMQRLSERAGDKPLQIKADGSLDARVFTGLLTELRGADIAEVRVITTHAGP